MPPRTGARLGIVGPLAGLCPGRGWHWCERWARERAQYLTSFPHLLGNRRAPAHSACVAFRLQWLMLAVTTSATEASLALVGTARSATSATLRT